jgi:hypothetical protein
MFVSAYLLFLVQPMVAKMILPLLGGTPAVWNTCMVFYQAVLLAGYAYTHVVTTRLRFRTQLFLQVILLCLPLLVLPIQVRDASPGDIPPALWLLGMLTIVVGLPFFLLATTAPLVQKWFANTDHPSARDPYFLYSASNFGSMLALLGYPTLVEPYLHLKADSWLSQSWLWALGYVVFLVLMAGCAWVVWQNRSVKKIAELESGDRNDQTESESGNDSPTWRTKLRWVGLAFVPSTMMLGVTTYMTLDVAAIPLLWVIPLTLYLLSFILVFSKWPAALHKAMVMTMPLLVLLLVFIYLSDTTSIVARILLNLLTLFVVALVCHGEIARGRPSTRYLTEYYLLMALGGVLGGMFNALLAPIAFWSVAEYPIALVIACLLLPQMETQERGWLSRWLGLDRGKWGIIVLDVILACIFGIVAFGFIRFLTKDLLPGDQVADVSGGFQKCLAWLNIQLANTQDLFEKGIAWVNNHVPGNASITRLKGIRAIVTYGIPVLACYSYVGRSFRFGLALGALLLAGVYVDSLDRLRVIHQTRSFFGVLKVEGDLANTYHRLVHGTTLHGEQHMDPDQRREPLTYYHRTGPLGQLFTAFSGPKRKEHLAFIGLGSGTVACYGEAGQDITFYEIDRAVREIALNPSYFTYYTDCPADKQISMGDARLKIKEAPDHKYGIIVVDAFSSDAIPIHLITREAIQLYFQKLAEGGIVAVHISNRYLDLRPVVANIAAHFDDQGTHLACIRQYDRDEDKYPGKSASDWVLLARRESDFGSHLQEDISAEELSDYDGDDYAPTDHKRWQRMLPDRRRSLWTDDFSNILSVFHW